MRASRHSSLHLQAFAKINLELRVVGRRGDGYHEIETLFQSIDLHDSLTLKLQEKPGIELRVQSPWPLPERENLVYRAAELVMFRGARDRAPLRGVRITLEKRIPIGAGLGGGSSDAAVTLVGLNKLLGLQLHNTELHSLALKLGSDVPYFLVGGLCRGRGRGELLERLPSQWGDYTFVLIKPPCSLSTEAVYREYDRLVKQGWRPPTDCTNDLEQAATRLWAQLSACRPLLAELKPDLWGMSGSGPTYYAAWRSRTSASQAYQALEELRKDNYWVAQAHPTEKGYHIK
ncbi:4-(cytidine 5'-diphospho)-2-C-methyl-D-erythritol kinase [Candidatus Acetothermia bacterium]|jgi:4-diphosphocytidyl-2-C-methyl-D-erythritol kinase|nr:4-(cytidine 5'-diphospho)-2-C-methyl-D-erythritol kinase [Candidatus Acetothermia bacterium]MCI2437399.1 4-(cytidine 5'-diphospho)-2-C-methyl-D-erythritol kinase [Candidatus Acetothermia bacterium]